mmetsp:Transcript_32137/g.55502  ORF Transcript_32137/g.55502 Transcript_32137/m.55502 type:complete len:528 (-) Transcript_32137:29-1612(-)
MFPFCLKDAQANGHEDFWQQGTPCKPLKQQCLYAGNLLQKSKKEDDTAYYMLTTTSLVKCHKDQLMPAQISIISWKHLEAVSTSGSEPMYGFRLYTSTVSETFYARTLLEQKGWLEKLSPLCILSDLDNSYQVLGEVGPGGTSCVRLAVCQKTSEEVAIKFVPKTFKGAQNCLKEAEMLRRINHPAVVRCIGVYDTADDIAMVLEYCRGGSLLNYIRRNKRVDEDIARDFMVKLLKCINACHMNACVHRDLKPDNILLTDPDDLLSMKLGDFGLACDLETEALGKRCGSAGYVAPEIILGGPQCSKLDIFSAGVILHILLSGTAPFYGSSELSVLKANARCRIDLSNSYWDHISSQAKSLVSKMLTKEPNLRIDSISALHHPWLCTPKVLKIPSIVEIGDSPIQQTLPLNIHNLKLFTESDLERPQVNRIHIFTEGLHTDTDAPHTSMTPREHSVIAKRKWVYEADPETPNTNDDSPNEKLSLLAAFSKSFDGKYRFMSKRLQYDAYVPPETLKRVKYKRRTMHRNS